VFGFVFCFEFCSGFVFDYCSGFCFFIVLFFLIVRLSFRRDKACLVSAPKTPNPKTQNQNQRNREQTHDIPDLFDATQNTIAIQ
jgi:hypothetical protein